MARVKRSTMAMKHRRNVLKRAKGYRFGRSKKEIEAKVALRHAGAHAFAHRKDKKTDMRRLWTARLNAGLRAEGITYSVFIGKLAKNGMSINRKMLADIAANNPETFKRILAQVK
ncbi:MAG: large subunit ribosomal protein [Patescibacteria group bacterium]|nr:large subunit ribosomal protein [Patescibacteria group bacterium]